MFILLSILFFFFFFFFFCISAAVKLPSDFRNADLRCQFQTYLVEKLKRKAVVFLPISFKRKETYPEIPKLN